MKRTNGDLGEVVCLTEPTDWLGGQLTAEAVSAVDFGRANNPALGNGSKFYFYIVFTRLIGNLPKSFLMLLETIRGNPGGCWVSSKCYSPTDLLRDFIWPHVEGKKNLKVFLNTVIKLTRTSATGKIIEIEAIQRRAVDGTTGWENTLSQVLEDWYVIS